MNALTVSQNTALQLLGLTSRQFRDAVREYDIPHKRVRSEVGIMTPNTLIAIARSQLRSTARDILLAIALLADSAGVVRGGTALFARKSGYARRALLAHNDMPVSVRRVNSRLWIIKRRSRSETANREA